MPWVALTERLLGPLVRFLGPRETGCIGFTERLLRNGLLAVPDPRTHRVYIRLTPEQRIDGAILQSLAGVYHPVLAPQMPVVEPEAVRLMLRASGNLYQVIGQTDDVVALETALGGEPAEAVDYHLMAQHQAPPELPLPRLPDRMTIRRAAAGEAQHLFDIQKKYEIEEVLLPGATFAPGPSLRHLEQTLASQVLVVGELDGVAIAKAGTNARGLFHDQIGGVFTERAWRSRGVATALMIRLLEIVAADHKTASLYVKKHNGPALTMYRNLGFGVDGGFRVSYYG